MGASSSEGMAFFAFGSAALSCHKKKKTIQRFWDLRNSRSRDARLVFGGNGILCLRLCSAFLPQEKKTIQRFWDLQFKV